MNSSTVPDWSFLAIEPAVKAASARLPEEVDRFLHAHSSIQRDAAFWRLFAAAERLVRKAVPGAASSRKRLATQTFYALVDLTELNQASDRLVQRRLHSAMSHEPRAPFAVVAEPDRRMASAS